MNQEPMDGDMSKLLKLLRKILTNHPQGPEISKLIEQKPYNLNICFFTFLPVGSEELDELEEFYGDFMNHEEEGSKRRSESLEFKLNSEDLNFLKSNGIRF